MPEDDKEKNAVKEVRAEVQDGGDDVVGKEAPSQEADATKKASSGGGEAVKANGKMKETREELPEADEFGLPVRPPRRRAYEDEDDEFQDASQQAEESPKELSKQAPHTGPERGVKANIAQQAHSMPDETFPQKIVASPGESGSAGQEAVGVTGNAAEKEIDESAKAKAGKMRAFENPSAIPVAGGARIGERQMSERKLKPKVEKKKLDNQADESNDSAQSEKESVSKPVSDTQSATPASNVIRIGPAPGQEKPVETSTHAAKKSVGGGVSEWSHQKMAVKDDDAEDKPSEGEWQSMPALATFRQYDDWGKVTAQAYDEVDDETVQYGQMGGAAKGYTRVQLDEDAQSATSMDDNTAYLFKEGYARNALDEEDEARDLISQMQTTKELLTEGQRIAYVGLVRLAIAAIVRDMEALERTKGAKKAVDIANEAVQMWGQKMMVRLYTHMEISAQEQVMVEQLAEHGLQAGDLTPPLMQNARVKNPEAKDEEVSPPEASSSARPSISAPRVGSSSDQLKTTSTTSLPASRPESRTEKTSSSTNLPTTGARSSRPQTPAAPGTPASEAPPPAYQQHTADDLHVENPDDYADTKSLDLDIRWTVLCDLFLLCLLYTSPSPRDGLLSRMPSSA